MMNWTRFIERLETYPQNTHVFRLPVSVERLNKVQEGFELLPQPLLSMIEHFNGAKLFNFGLPMLRLFGISEDPPLDELEWAEDWYIDKFTPTWRSAEKGRESQFAIGMTSYGGVIIYDQGLIKEWDTSELAWAPSDYELGDWLEKVLQDGDTMLRELDTL